MLSKHTFAAVAPSILGLLQLVVLCTPADAYSYKTMYIDSLVDHFNFNSDATFKLRYLINDTFWSNKPESPIFFYTGNEGDINLFAENTGFMWEIAPEFEALIVFAEHRYYGESLPFGDKSQENLGYLSSSQALMDFVELITYLQSQQDHHDHPVIVFGGSYGGMLSAWMRMKYPATVTGAIAASAPIWLFPGMTPCEAYNEVVTSNFDQESTICSDNIRKSWDTFDDITKTDEGKAWLSSAWKLCSPLETQEDVAALFSYYESIFFNLAMVNYPYPANFTRPLPGHPVKFFCETLKVELQGKKLLEALFNGLNMYFNYSGNSNCLHYLSDNDNLGSGPWGYQCCTEMVESMCSDGKNDFFRPSKGLNITLLAMQCLSQYDVQIQPNLARELYGGKDISSASNIIFSNGLLDPWSKGGVLYNVSETVIAVVMKGAAHHLDLRASNPLDPEDVINTRNFHRHIIHQWISQHNSHKQTSSF